MRILAIALFASTILCALTACGTKEKPQQPAVQVVVPETPTDEPGAAPASEPATDAPAAESGEKDMPPAAVTEVEAPATTEAATNEPVEEQPKVVGSIGRAFFNALMEPESDQKEPSAEPGSGEEKSSATPAENGASQP